MQAFLSFITLGVDNLPKMTAFYQDILGRELMKASAEVAFFRLSDCTLALFPADKLAEDIGVTNDGVGFKRFALALNFESETAVDAVCQSLAEKGVNIVKPPEKVPWGGYRGYFADPENNYWEIAYNPRWEKT